MSTGAAVADRIAVLQAQAIEGDVDCAGTIELKDAIGVVAVDADVDRLRTIDLDIVRDRDLACQGNGPRQAGAKANDVKARVVVGIDDGLAEAAVAGIVEIADSKYGRGPPWLQVFNLGYQDSPAASPSPR